jgi:hypothetical protein
MTAKPVRAKLSTTVAPENYQYLTAMVSSGQASSVAEAVDRVVTRVRRIENRRRLEQATADYFESLSPEALAEENKMATNLAAAVKGMEFDREP